VYDLNFIPEPLPLIDAEYVGCLVDTTKRDLASNQGDNVTH